jgi:hypothetical protein
MSKNVYFFCCTGGDALICSGISKIIKDLDYEYKTTLLLPAHPRVKGKSDSLSIFFDDIIELPFCYFSSNPFLTLKEAFSFRKSILDIRFPDKSLFFMFDVYELAELIFYDTIYNLQNQRKITILSAFDGGELNKKNRKILLKGTILKSFYSIILTQNLFYEFKTKNSNFAGLNFYDTKCDLQICINRSQYVSDPIKLIRNVSYPPNIFINNHLYLDYFLKLFEREKVIILLVESIYAAGSKDYWIITNTIIDNLLLSGYKVFIKDHPSAKLNFEVNINSKFVYILDNKLNLEEIFIGNRDNIVAVLGYGSTALITASWLGICSINLSELYHFDGYIKARFKNFVSLGSDVVTLSSLSDILMLDYFKNIYNDSLKKIYDECKVILSHLETI